MEWEWKDAATLRVRFSAEEMENYGITDDGGAFQMTRGALGDLLGAVAAATGGDFTGDSTARFYRSPEGGCSLLLRVPRARAVYRLDDEASLRAARRAFTALAATAYRLDGVYYLLAEPRTASLCEFGVRVPFSGAAEYIREHGTPLGNE